MMTFVSRVLAERVGRKVWPEIPETAKKAEAKFGLFQGEPKSSLDGLARVRVRVSWRAQFHRINLNVFKGFLFILICFIAS
jgi:hypothetical protein